MKRFSQYLVYLAALVFMKIMERLPRRTFRALAWFFSWIALPIPRDPPVTSTVLIFSPATKAPKQK